MSSLVIALSVLYTKPLNAHNKFYFENTALLHIQCAYARAEVNGQRLLGMNHLEVVAILKELPQDVRMVCARIEEEEELLTEENIRKKLDFDLSGTTANISEVMPASDRLVKAKSDGSLATSGGGTDDSFTKLKSR